jgi:hypothetical protein
MKIMTLLLTMFLIGAIIATVQNCHEYKKAKAAKEMSMKLYKYDIQSGERTK